MSLTARLELKNYSVLLGEGAHPVAAISNVSLSISPGETVALVGESGSGKSALAQAIFGILQTSKCSGEVWLDKICLSSLTEMNLARLRGHQMGLIFQEASRALNPFLAIGRQLEEGLIFHRKMTRREARAEVRKLLLEMGFIDPDSLMKQFSHELSGGMRQRVVIAMILLLNPSLIIADEPTTALDVTLQKQILNIFQNLQKKTATAILFITHNMGVAAFLADRIAVLYAGRLVEVAPKDAFFQNSKHPYSRALIQATPSLNRRVGEPWAAMNGQAPDARNLPSGCAFAPRCPRAQTRCQEEIPIMTANLFSRHDVACWNPHASDSYGTKVGAL